MHLKAAEAALLLGSLGLHLRPLAVGHLNDARLLVLERRPRLGVREEEELLVEHDVDVRVHLRAYGVSRVTRR